MNRPVTLALLPFENLSDDPADGRLATGFLHDLIAEVSRFPSLGVIATDSVFAAGGHHEDVLGVARRLGADYLLQGSVRRWPENLRISVQLVEARTGRHVWAGRYDTPDLLAVHDEIAAKVANALSVQVDRTLIGNSRRRKDTTLEAYECWLRGMECLMRGQPDTDVEGRQFFARALKSDPSYARAHAGISLSHFNEWSCQAWDKWEEKERLAYDHAAKAEALDPEDALVQVILGRIEQYRREFASAGPRFERALRLAPNDANILIQVASSLAYQGEAERGWALAQRAMVLNPLCPDWFYCYAAMPAFPLKRYETALEMAAKAPPGLVVDVPAYKAAACAFLGRRKEAAAFLQEFREDFARRICSGRTPGPDELLRWILHVNPYRRDEDTAHLAEGLRRAGLEGSASRPVPVSEPMAWPISNVFRKEGPVWTLSYEHQVVQMADMRGLHDLARLMQQPGAHMASADLASAKVHTRGLEQTDANTLRSCRARLRELEEDIAEGSGAGDVARVAKLEEEREKILAELKKITGLGGRMRQTGGAAERARTAVTWRIRSAIKKITGVHPSLGRHLANSVTTGAICSYQPERPTDWRL